MSLDPLEVRVEDYLRDRVTMRRGLCIKLNPVWYVGIPDRLVLLPGERIAFIETKKRGKKARKGQRRVINKLRELGFTAGILDTREKVDDWLDGGLTHVSAPV